MKHQIFMLLIFINIEFDFYNYQKVLPIIMFWSVFATTI